ncbi:MAG: type II toxin-antitoxin system prevent-host-death family antitoxin [Candidatus Sericytochromatia bacterium]|nr:type II toxin-antitoxin system prevent-host-death family antitoxin [Candidatus Tanganyikabacteria bacterium]
MTRVGIRVLKAKLSEYVALANSGERVIVTDHGREVAELVPLGRSEDEMVLWEMVKTGRAEWSGRKFTPPGRRVTIVGRPISETMLEDREGGV